MEKKAGKTKKSFSADWLIRGVLTKLGDTFDRWTGRNYQPSSSLATSELVERLKLLLDQEARKPEEGPGGGRFVPHHIKLKMQWDKFSADSEEALAALENELHIAAVDHINDQRYYTYAPITIEIKPDYFTTGVKLLASFDKFDADEREAAVNVSVPDLKIEGLSSHHSGEDQRAADEREIFILTHRITGKPVQIELAFEPGERKSIGRTKENDLVLEDDSVSKIHAALVFNSQNRLVLADTGSTNGTFINGKRMAYGRAYNVSDGDLLKFGSVEVGLGQKLRETEIFKLDGGEIPKSLPAESAPELAEASGPAPTARADYPPELPGTGGEKEPSGQPSATGVAEDEISEISPGEEDADPGPTRPGIVLDFGDQ